MIKLCVNTVTVSHEEFAQDDVLKINFRESRKQNTIILYYVNNRTADMNQSRLFTVVYRPK